jgi:tetratricopeptide (TPR) repeat protein
VSGDWDEVLRWDSRIDELVAGQVDGAIFNHLHAFGCAYEEREKWDKAGPLLVRCAEACEALKMFSQQVDMLRRAGEDFVLAGETKNSCLWYESARDVCKQQGFVSMESKMCSRLGGSFIKAGRFPDGVEQHRRAFQVAYSLRVNDASHAFTSLERTASRGLVEALCLNGQLEDAATLFNLLREEGDNSADSNLFTHYLRGMIQLANHNIPGAALSYQSALGVAQQHPELLEDENAASALRSAKINLTVCDVGAGGAHAVSMVAVVVQTAREARDWPGVLRWESRLEELLTLKESANPRHFLTFALANLNQGHFANAARLFQRRVQLLGKLERFSDQGVDMCQVGECFLHLKEENLSETWYQKARKLGEKHGCYAVECAASLGLGRVELYLRGNEEGAEGLLRHALSVLDFVEIVEFVEGGYERTTLEKEVKGELAKMLVSTDRHEEAGPLIQRLRELAGRAGSDPLEMVEALGLAVNFQVGRRDRAQAWAEMQVLPSDPISHPLLIVSRNQDPTSRLHHKLQPAVADATLVLCTRSGTNCADP